MAEQMPLRHETLPDRLFAKLLFLVDVRRCMPLMYLMCPSVNEDHRSCTTQRAIFARGFWTVGLCAELFS